MTTKAKIKIVDDSNIRKEIDELYEKTNQITLAKWSLAIAKHILLLVEIDNASKEIIIEGFRINEMWQSGKARMHDVRQSGFKVHKLARECDDEIKKTALRVVGQAIASGHMREHSMVASDYAVKVVGMMTSNDNSAISDERKWQLEELKKLVVIPSS